MEVFKIKPLIQVFHNAIEKPQEIIDFFENGYKWDDWYTFGKSLFITNIEPNHFESFPEKEKWDKVLTSENTEEYKMLKRLTDGFYESTKLYFEDTQQEFKDMYFMSFDIANYHAGEWMDYHTDYIQQKENFPGFKFHTTAVIYLNDDYDGGELSFIELNKDKEILWVYDYKPKAGDVVVFPSTPPFYHSSLKTENGTKYIVRTYWRTNQEPTEEWEEGIKKYGEEEWIKQQEEKAKEIETQINKTIDGRNFGINVIINKDEENEF